MNPRVVLIGLDGATYTILDRLVEQGEMPFLRGLLETGVRAELRSVVPPLTPPAWTSLMTGRQPGRHGIFDFLRAESPGGSVTRLMNSRDIGCDTIWTMLSRHGLRATVLNFPITFPAPPMNGYLVPGWIPPRQLRLGCHPADLFDRLKKIPGFDPRSLGFDIGLEEKAIEGCETDEYEDWIRFHIRRERQWLAIFRTLVEEDPCEVMAVLFDGVDKLQHLFWRFIDPALFPAEPTPWERRIRDLCLEYFRELDRILEEIVGSAGPGANVVIASDHGFGDLGATFFVNSWLERQGLLAWADRPETGDRMTWGIGQIGHHVRRIDWSRTRAFAATPSANSIFIARASETYPAGVSEEEYAGVRDRIVRELLRLENPVTGERLVEAVLTREEAFPGPFMDVAPDLTVVFRGGVAFSVLASDELVRPVDPVRGAHRPEGVFIARGPAFRSGAAVDPLDIVDVAPLVLQLLGVPAPEGLDGRLPTAALAAEAAVPATPVSTGDPGLLPDLPDEAELDAESEAEILRRLHDLGYVE